MQQFKAFTVEYSGTASSLQTQCGVCPGVAIEALAAGEKHPEVKTVDRGRSFVNLNPRRIRNGIGVAWESAQQYGCGIC